MSFSVTAAAEKPPSLLEMAHAILAATWRRRHVIVLPILILPFAGFVVGKFAPRTYETKMTLLIQDPGKNSPSVSDISVGANLKDRMESLKALLVSHRVLLGVAEDLGLIPKDAPRLLQNGVVKGLEASVQVRLIGNEMLEFTYKASHPEGMDKVLSRIGQRFVERVMAPEDSSTRESVTFLDKQLKDAEAALAKGDTELSEFKARNAQVLPDQRQNNLTRLAQQRDLLNEHETRLAGVEAEFKTLRDRLVQTDPVIGRLEQDIVAASAELAQLNARYTENHSLVVAAQRKLVRIEEERTRLVIAGRNAPPVDMDRLWNMAATSISREDGKQPLLVSQVATLENARTRTEQLRDETASLRASVKDLDDRIVSSGEVEREMRERERDIATKADAVQQLRRRYATAKTTSELSAFQAPERIKLVDAPVEPTGPTRPLTLLFVWAGIFGGIFLGVSIACFLEMLDPSVRRMRDMEKLIGRPVLDRIPPLPSA